MSRWSKEEDSNILQNIKVLEDEPNYVDLVEYHNELFNTNRTEQTYKARVAKIAKENGILLKSNNHWTPEDKERLIKVVSDNPLNINWTEVGLLFNRSEASVRTMYNNLVEPDKHVEYCISKICESDIDQIMKKLETVCNKCNRRIFNTPLSWGENNYCEECHYELFNNEINIRWKQIAEYSCKTGKDKCNICNKIYDFMPQSLCKFNYDHKNMFEKSNTIYAMNKRGMNLEDIYKEIDLCQLLCVSCHTIITSIEQKTGFNRIKINMTREFNKTNNVEQKEKISKYYSEIYENYMNNIYKIIKKLI